MLHTPHLLTIVMLCIVLGKVKLTFFFIYLFNACTEHVDGAEAVGATSLFDALKSGSDQLEEFVTKCDKIPPEGCLRRIICLVCT